jgi:hypothetical protein
MTLTRRAFLGSAVASCFGLGGAARANLGDHRREKLVTEIHRWIDYFDGPVDGAGYLDQPAYAIDRCLRAPQVPYDPQPGDLFFSITNTKIYSAGHRISGAGQPSHCGTIFRRPDGSMAMLEAGTFDVPVITASDLIPVLVAYDNREPTWIRTRAVPLTEEQSFRLTKAAMAQEGKPFATFRMVRQVTPFRARGPLRTYIMGGPHGPDRRAYYCAELTAEMIVAAGLIDPANARPSATYPSDLFFDESRDRFLNAHFKLCPCWNPPARWRSCLNKPDGNSRKGPFGNTPRRPPG